MSYNKTIKKFVIKNEKLNRYRSQMVNTTVSVDPLGMCSVSFGIAYSVSISSDDLNTLIGALKGAAREQNILRLKKNSEIDCTSLRDAEEERRRDEKNGLYPGKWDPCN